MQKKIICGIYKITNPSGKVYIGESKDIYKRWKQYKCIGSSKRQTILNKSFIKYGWKEHTFEILEQCDFDDLLCRERYWQDFYDVTNSGLNCRLTTCGDIKGILSDSTKAKIKQNHADTSGENCFWFGKTLSEEHRKNISNSRKENGSGKGKNNPMFGVSLTSYWKGKNIPQETKDKISKTLKARNKTTHNAKLVLLLDFGIFCDSITQASEMLSVNRRALTTHLQIKSNKYRVAIV